MDIKQAFSVLREHLGPDRACASLVGVKPQHYEAMRNGRVNIPARTADYIILKASGLKACPLPVSQAEPACEEHSDGTPA